MKENIFTAEGGVRRGIPNVLVVLTDGRSQDDVNKVSKEMQMEGQNSGVGGLFSFLFSYIFLLLEVSSSVFELYRFHLHLIASKKGKTQSRFSALLILFSTFRSKGYIVFAIGFADADYGELVSIASKPSDRHVFFVDDLDAFQRIEEKLVTFVCEAATASE